MAVQIFKDGAWRTLRGVYRDGAWRTPREAYAGGAWRSIAMNAIIASISASKDDHANTAWCSFSTGEGTQSAVVKYSRNGGAWTTLQTIDTTPNSGPYTSNAISVANGDRVDFSVTGWTGESATGTEGETATATVFMEAAPGFTAHSITKDDTANTVWVQGINVTNGTRSFVVEYEVNGGARQALQTINVTPGGTGYQTNSVTANNGDTVQFFMWPYSNSNGGGELGGGASPSIALVDDTPAVTWTVVEADEVNNRMRVRDIDINAYTQSIRVLYRINAGTYSQLQIIDTTPGVAGYLTDWVTANEGDTIDIALEPYSGDAATGTQGTVVVRSHTIAIEQNPAIATSSATADNAANTVHATFTVNADALSVRVEYKINDAATWNALQIINTIEGTTYNTNSVSANDGDTVHFLLTPYVGQDATGAAGTAVAVQATLSVPAYSPAVTYHVIEEVLGGAQSTFSVNLDTDMTEVTYRLNSGPYTWLEDIDHTGAAGRELVKTSVVSATSGDVVEIRLRPRAPDLTWGNYSSQSITLTGSGSV